jgi:acetoin utilization protein AcuB
MRLKEIMTTPVEVISPRASIRTAERRLKAKQLHHLVVVDGKAVLGLVTAASLKDRGAEGATRVADAMIRNITVLNPEMTVADAAALMMPDHPQTAVPVVHGNRLVGIVTVSDLLDLAGHIDDQQAALR